MATYGLIVKPKHCFNKSVLEGYRSGSVELSEMRKYIYFNNDQRELIKDIIESECVKRPTITEIWLSTDESVCFSIYDLHVYYDESAGMCKKDVLNSLRYIGEELLPWVESVTLIGSENPPK